MCNSLFSFRNFGFPREGNEPCKVGRLSRRYMIMAATLRSRTPAVIDLFHARAAPLLLDCDVQPYVMAVCVVSVQTLKRH